MIIRKEYLYLCIQTLKKHKMKIFNKSQRKSLLSKLKDVQGKRCIAVQSKQHFLDKDQQDVADLCQLDIVVMDNTIDFLMDLLADNKL